MIPIFRVNCRILYIFIIIVFSSLSTVIANEATQRIYAHLIIRDHHSAVEEAKHALHTYPNEQSVYEAAIKAFAFFGDEKNMVNVWNHYVQRFPEQRGNRDLLEEMAWGILNKGINSNSPLIRIYSTLGGFFSRDAKGIALLQKSLNDNNAAVRVVALKLASNQRDQVLKEEVIRHFHNKKHWFVHLEAIRAVGKMKIRELKPSLEMILVNSKSSAEEKKAAMESLIDLYDEVSRDDLAVLTKSNRAELKRLGCEIASVFDLKDNVDLIYPLVDDHNSKVRAHSLRTLGILRHDPISHHLNDVDPEVAIAAAWLMMLNHPIEGQNALRPWLSHESREIQRLAAGALVASGKYGLPLMEEAFKHTRDSYVRMNLAIGLIIQRVKVESACIALDRALSTNDDSWIWKKELGFKMIVPNRSKGGNSLNDPEINNQLVRLEVLNILAMMHYPGTQKAIENYLNKRSWGIAGAAAALLLTECDESAIDLVKGLLYHSDKKIRIQAAIILAMWGRDEDAIALLELAYPQENREMKERIIESVGRVGSEASIPFLVERLSEPSQSLRIIAASSLIQTLYH